MPCILVEVDENDDDDDDDDDDDNSDNNNNNNNNISMMKITYLLIKLKFPVYVILPFSGFTHLLQNHLAHIPNRYSVT